MSRAAYRLAQTNSRLSGFLLQLFISFDAWLPCRLWFLADFLACLVDHGLVCLASCGQTVACLAFLACLVDHDLADFLWPALRTVAWLAFSGLPCGPWLGWLFMVCLADHGLIGFLWPALQTGLAGFL